MNAPDAQPRPPKDSTNCAQYPIFCKIQIVEVDMFVIDVLFIEEQSRAGRGFLVFPKHEVSISDSMAVVEEMGREWGGKEDSRCRG